MESHHHKLVLHERPHCPHCVRDVSLDEGHEVPCERESESVPWLIPQIVIEASFAMPLELLRIPMEHSHCSAHRSTE